MKNFKVSEASWLTEVKKVLWTISFLWRFSVHLQCLLICLSAKDDVTNMLKKEWHISCQTAGLIEGFYT